MCRWSTPSCCFVVADIHPVHKSRQTRPLALPMSGVRMAVKRGGEKWRPILFSKQIPWLWWSPKAIYCHAMWKASQMGMSEARILEEFQKELQALRDGFRLSKKRNAVELKASLAQATKRQCRDFSADFEAASGGA